MLYISTLVAVRVDANVLLWRSKRHRIIYCLTYLIQYYTLAYSTENTSGSPQPGTVRSGGVPLR
jgi:hypothetical protein